MNRRRGSGRRVTVRKHNFARKRTASGRKRRTYRKGPYYFGSRRVSAGRRTSKLALESLAHGFIPAGYRVGRLFNRPRIQQLSQGMGTARGYRRLTTGRSVSKRMRAASRRASRRRTSAKRTTRRASRRRRASKLAANGRRRRSRRRVSRRRSSRRRASRRASRRRSSRRGSRRRGGSRRRRLTANVLVASGMNVRGGKGTKSRRKGYATGPLHQIVELGPRSKRKGYPVYVPAHISTTAYLRRFTFGGAAKAAHARRSSVKKNRRHSMRRRHTRRNPNYVVVKNGRRRGRRMRANLFGANIVNDVVIPGAGGVAGFLAARLVSNVAAGQSWLTGALDAGAADPENTKLLANAVGIAATLGIAQKVPMVRKHQGALVTGMGLALADRLIRKFAPGQSVLSGFGEYVNQPMGEYVNQPMAGLGAYVQDPSAMGEYVNQPMSGLGSTYYAAAGMGTMYAAAGYPEGQDPANQESIDGLMDVMEAAAGGPFEAAAGMGTYYAAAGLGAEADATLEKMYAKEQPPFVSTETPTDLAMTVTRDMVRDKKVPTSLVTPEGRGFAGGLFARHLFAGMLGA